MKRADGAPEVGLQEVSPGLIAGGGLKQPRWHEGAALPEVSPGLIAGGGLKQCVSAPKAA